MAHFDQASSLRARDVRPGCDRILGVVSGKGGVGKSTLAANLATACAQRGAHTLLIDGDAGLANADLLLGVLPQFELADWCAGRARLDDVVCAAPDGLELMVSGTGPEAGRALLGTMNRTDAGELSALVAARDVTILDLGAGIGRAVLALASNCDAVWLVVTPEPTSLADAYAMARELWAERPSLRIEIVVNRAPDRATGERTYQALQRLTRRFVGHEVCLRGVLLEDPAMIRAVARQVPVVRAFPGAHIARQLARLAEALLDEWAWEGPARGERRATEDSPATSKATSREIFPG